jgi:hypothetical protein
MFANHWVEPEKPCVIHADAMRESGADGGRIEHPAGGSAIATVPWAPQAAHGHFH